ncbi:alpha-E domain-containing protein [Luteimicrobium subarcticum]|uniref:Putative alpha-E superfamily protein n=1 Tax=Luteimicrobium subarcticum TaxID=620910 RepID=A0A2M8WR00_9MICO|nr:alpha-E domain-containing protein [Luteimicrobium subarcticum]PJI93347.1 putative alpha-E superfamily protein [Luteimicrobium subarcticum]
MLSRIAESLFWIGRYVERADDTARILDVHLQSLSEDPWASEDLTLRALLAVMDHPVPADGTLVTRARVMQLLAHDQLDASSIAGSMIAARENARRARETVSSELWETLNTTRNQVSGPMRLARPHDYFGWVRERAAIVAGIMDSSTSHDETWLFVMLGRSIERADMTARLVQTQAQLRDSGPSWSTLLRAAGGYEAFLRTFRGVASDEKAAEFLLLDRLFPRSIVHALDAAEDCLRLLEPTADRRGVTNDARRELARMRATLEYSPVGETLEVLPVAMEDVQRCCSEASDAIKARYFPSAAATTWMGEAL